MLLEPSLRFDARPIFFSVPAYQYQYQYCLEIDKANTYCNVENFTIYNLELGSKNLNPYILYQPQNLECWGVETLDKYVPPRLTGAKVLANLLGPFKPCLFLPAIGTVRDCAVHFWLTTACFCTSCDPVCHST